MDGVDPDDVATAGATVSALGGIGDVLVRGRWMGRSLILDVEGTLPADTTLVDLQGIGRQVEQAVRESVPAARQVTWRARTS